MNTHPLSDLLAWVFLVACAAICGLVWMVRGG